MITSDLIRYYQSLLILQYSSLPNAGATVALLVGELLQNQIIQQVRDGFDLDTALGAQLNILASYRGLARILFGSLAGQDWSIPEYLDPNPGGYLGLVEYADPDPNWLTLQYDDLLASPTSLSDFQLRTLVKLKAQLDFWDGTLGSLDAILFSFFGTQVNVVDNEDMTMVYQHKILDPDPDTIWKLAVIAGVPPHPAGVSFTTVEV